MPTIVLLEPSELEHRLDAVYYSPSFLANHDRLVRSGLRTTRLQSLVKQGRRAVYFSTDTVEADIAPESWIPFLTSDDLTDDGFFINLDARRRVSPEFAAEYPNGRLRGNELLVKVKGPSQTTAYNAHVPKRDILVSGTIWGAIVDLEAVDPHFLVAVLTSPYGATARSRLRTNTNVEFLAPDDLGEVLLPWPARRLSQNYIGDKVRQAERLQAESRRLEAAIHAKLDPVVPHYSTTPQKCSRVSCGILTDRFDTQPYRTHFLSLLDSIRGIAHNTLSSLASVTGGDPVPSELFGTEGIPLVRIRDITKAGFSNPEVRIPETYALQRKEALAAKGMIVVGMDGEFRAQFFLCEELPQLVNQRVAILKTHGIRPELLTVWLNRNEGQYQLNRWTTQTTVGHIGLDDIRTVLVPRLDEKVEAELADKALTARQCVWYAHALTTSAKLLVEALIEAKVTEPELVAAQEALGRGDDTADRALLRRLTRHGFDVPGQPSLFPDLDALYTLLGQTTEEQS